MDLRHSVVTSHTSGARSNRSKGVALAVLATAQLVIALAYSIVNMALPYIGRSLGFSGGTVQWVISSYALTFGGFLLLGGRAADLLGRRGNRRRADRAAPGHSDRALHVTFATQAAIALLGAAVALLVIGRGAQPQDLRAERDDRGQDPLTQTAA